MMNMDVHATEYYLEKIAFADKKDDYVRLQKVTTCPMDKVAPSDITNLKNDGLELFQDNKEKIVKFIKMNRLICFLCKKLLKKGKKLK